MFDSIFEDIFLHDDINTKIVRDNVIQFKEQYKKDLGKGDDQEKKFAFMKREFVKVKFDDDLPKILIDDNNFNILCFKEYRNNVVYHYDQNKKYLSEVLLEISESPEFLFSNTGSPPRATTMSKKRSRDLSTPDEKSTPKKKFSFSDDEAGDETGDGKSKKRKSKSKRKNKSKRKSKSKKRRSGKHKNGKNII